MSDDTYDLKAEMASAELTGEDLMAMTGVSATTLWRWQSAAPTYVRTIIRLHRRVTRLQRRLDDLETPAGHQGEAA